MSKNNHRLYLPKLSDLIDQLTIDQIKEVLKPTDKESYANEIKKIVHDLDIIIKDKQIQLNARLIRIIVIIAQMNLHIWYNKDKMQENPQKYDELLKLAHQLNGLRNQMKNLLLEEIGDKEKSAKKTNYNTDGLQGWNISI